MTDTSELLADVDDFVFAVQVERRPDDAANLIGKLAAEVRRLTTRADTAEAERDELGALLKRWVGLIRSDPQLVIEQIRALTVPSPDTTTPRAEQAGDDHP